MIIIAAVDDRNGMMFNGRRQSRDRVLTEKIMSVAEGGRLWISEYTAKMIAGQIPDKFEELVRKGRILVDDDLLEKAGPEDFCFIEDTLPGGSEADEIILFKWNRSYPADTYFDADVSGWTLTGTDTFEGSSHENITMEVYVPGK